MMGGLGVEVDISVGESATGERMLVEAESAVGWERGGCIGFDTSVCVGACAVEQATSKVIKRRESFFIVLFTKSLDLSGDVVGEQSFAVGCEMDSTVGEFVHGHNVPQVEVVPACGLRALRELCAIHIICPDGVIKIIAELAVRAVTY